VNDAPIPAEPLAYFSDTDQSIQQLVRLVANVCLFGCAVSLLHILIAVAVTLWVQFSPAAVRMASSSPWVLLVNLPAAVCLLVMIISAVEIRRTFQESSRRALVIVSMASSFLNLASGLWLVWYYWGSYNTPSIIRSYGMSWVVYQLANVFITHVRYIIFPLMTYLFFRSGQVREVCRDAVELNA